LLSRFGAVPACAALRFASACAALFFVSACASVSSSRDADAPEGTRALRVLFVDWRSDQRLTLVDQSHTDRAKLYSSTRPLDEAGTKVTTDEVLEETLKFFREQGYFDHARKGPAPAGTGVVQSLEVEMPGSTLHMSFGRSTPSAEQKVFRTCRDNFVALYNNVYQLQSVDRPPDWDTQQRKLQLQPSGKSGGSS